MIDALPPPHPPVVERPVSYAASYGIVSGVADSRTRRVVVRAGGRVLGAVAVRDRRFSLQVELPQREVTVEVLAVGPGGGRARTRVPSVQGMSRAAAPVERPLRLHRPLGAALRRLARGYGGSSAMYVLDLTSGQGAAWNAQAEFPGASALKLAVAVMALATADGVPARGSRLDRLLRRMLIVSDNVAANEVEIWAGGSTSGGSRRVNALMSGLGLNHTEMYGGYIPGTFSTGRARVPAARIPLRADDRPAWGVGKRTTAHDLGSLLRSVWLASGGLGPLPRAQPRFTAADARYLLYLLARVDDPGKLDRFLRGRPGVTVIHKAGWIDAARHDNGLVVWKGGVLLATVMTYRRAGVGVREDVLAGRTALAALRAFRG